MSKRTSALSSARLKPMLALAAISMVLTGGTAHAASAVLPEVQQHHASYTLAGETIEQRIRNLHFALKITPAEEADWNRVANVMRSNEVEMQKLVADRKIEAHHFPSAVDDLKAYEKFNRAHVDGLKELIASFENLYITMPDGQKVLADHVFHSFGHDGLRQHS